eukprot:m.135060 g.135060  ORF g.135060 m.135060 type:complete len:366 (-) comp29774_c0_seq1:490-1587(-)
MSGQLMMWCPIALTFVGVGISFANAATDETNTTDSEIEAVQKDAGSWWDTLDDSERAILLSSCTLFLIVVVGFLVRVCFVSCKKTPTPTGKRKGPRPKKDEFVVGKSSSNPMRAPEFKAILDILQEHGDFDEIDPVKDSRLFVGVIDVPVNKSEHILGIKVGELITHLDQEKEWHWGSCNGCEGWFDPKTVRELTKSEIKEIQRKSNKNKHKHKKKTNKPRPNSSAISTASTSVASSNNISALLKSPPTAEDTLAWDAADLASPQAREKSKMTKPTKSNHAVDAAVALRTKQDSLVLSMQQRKAEILKQQKATAEKKAKAAAVVEAKQATVKVDKTPTPMVQPQPPQEGPPIDPMVAKNFYDMFN